jgi:hypothetical protein
MLQSNFLVAEPPMVNLAIPHSGGYLTGKVVFFEISVRVSYYLDIMN